MGFELHPIKLQLKVNWKLSRNEALEKQNYILTDGEFKSEIAPNIRYGETPEIIANNFKEFKRDPKVEGKTWCQSFKNAVVNLQLKQKHGSLSEAIELKPQAFATSFSLPIMDLNLVSEYLKQNDQFQFYKVKIDQDVGTSFVREVAKNTDKPLRVDANEGFTSLENYLEFEKELSAFNIQFIEQPFPAKFTSLYQELKSQSKYEIIADESVLDHFDENLFPQCFHGVNVKLMKTGGILKAKEILAKAKARKMKTMVGCMIETSLGIYEAAHLVSLCDYIDLDGALLVSNDPYQEYFQLNQGIMIPKI